METAPSISNSLIDLEIWGKLNDAASGRQIAVDLPVAVADVDVNGLSLQLPNRFRAGVPTGPRVTYVDTRSYSRMGALIDKAHHLGDIIEEAQAERFEFQGDIDLFLFRHNRRSTRQHSSAQFRWAAGGVASRCQRYSPSTRRMFLALSSVRQVDEISCIAGHMELPHRIIEVNETGRHHGQRNNRQFFLSQVASGSTVFLRD